MAASAVLYFHEVALDPVSLFLLELTGVCCDLSRASRAVETMLRDHRTELHKGRKSNLKIVELQ
jgi:hypothetical protein